MSQPAANFNFVNKAESSEVTDSKDIEVVNKKPTKCEFQTASSLLSSNQQLMPSKKLSNAFKSAKDVYSSSQANDEHKPSTSSIQQSTLMSPPPDRKRKRSSSVSKKNKSVRTVSPTEKVTYYFNKSPKADSGINKGLMTNPPSSSPLRSSNSDIFSGDSASDDSIFSSNTKHPSNKTSPSTADDSVPSEKPIAGTSVCRSDEVDVICILGKYNYLTIVQYALLYSVPAVYQQVT